MQSCLHVLTTSLSRCDRCHLVVKKSARLAARLRGRHGAADSTLPVIVPQGTSTHVVVKGDVVGEVTLCVRPRRALLAPGAFNTNPSPDPEHLKTDLVAEITGGVNLDAVGLYVGLVVEVKTNSVVTLSSGTKS